MIARRAELAGLFGIVALLAAAAHAQVNAGFEASAATGVPGWRIQDRGAAIGVDMSTSHRGAASLRVTAQDGGGRSRFSQDINATGLHGERVRISAYLKTSTATTGLAALRVSVRDHHGIVYVDRTETGGAADTQGWRRLELEAPLVPGAVALSLGGELAGDGTAWFDDFAIEAIAMEMRPPPSTAVTRYITQALDLIEQHSLVRGAIDWPEYRAQVMRQARGAVAVPDAYVAVRFAVGGLGDGHSFFRTAGQAAALVSEPVENGRTRRPVIEPRAETLDASIGYLRLPGFAGGNHRDHVEFAEHLQALIAATDATAACGWIVDLRGNSGGNLWPMLTGLGPLLGDGEAGALHWPDGERRSFWYRDGKAGLGDYVQLRVRGAPYAPPRASRIAVLIDRDTASAAEILTLALARRIGTRTFGEPSRGASSGTRTFTLADGAEIVLAVAGTSDRDGRIQIGPVAPDVPIAAARGSVLAEQPAIVAARRWLAATPCGAGRL